MPPFKAGRPASSLDRHVSISWHGGCKPRRVSNTADHQGPRARTGFDRPSTPGVARTFEVAEESGLSTIEPGQPVSEAQAILPGGPEGPSPEEENEPYQFPSPPKGHSASFQDPPTHPGEKDSILPLGAPHFLATRIRCDRTFASGRRFLAPPGGRAIHFAIRRSPGRRAVWGLSSQGSTPGGLGADRR